MWKAMARCWISADVKLRVVDSNVIPATRNDVLGARELGSKPAATTPALAAAGAGAVSVPKSLTSVAVTADAAATAVVATSATGRCRDAVALATTSRVRRCATSGFAAVTGASSIAGVA
jgi:hypothetical protein